MLIAKRLWIIFFILFLIITQAKVVAATDLKLPNTIINPDKYMFYSVKRLVEKTILFTKLTKDSKADYYRELSLKRMAELKYVVENNLLGEIERGSQRLSYQVGVFSDYINTNKDELGKEKLATVDLFLGYKSLLSELRDKYPANSSFWMLIQHSINSIDLNMEKLK